LGQSAHFGEDVVERLLAALGEGIRSVAIRAAEIAGGEPDKNALQPGEGAFALEAQVDFVDDQRVRHRVEG
jgi:hypothetical protein